MKPIRILLVEDDPFWIDQLRNDLGAEPDMEIGAAVSTKEDAVRCVRQGAFDVALMDIQLTAHGTDGLLAAREIAKLSDCKVIMLTSFTDRELIVDSFKYGAVNFVGKDSYPDIVDAIRGAHRSRSGIHHSSAHAVLREMRLSRLTAAERVVYEMKEQGLNRLEIAKRLHRSAETVKSQLRNVARKLKD